ncbi:MAG: DUF1684 domain-containing protein [Crocinitomicaceae bacterium]
MKLALTVTILIIQIISFTQTSDSLKLQKIRDFQTSLNHDYKDKTHSPLTKKDRRKFKGHHFYDSNLQYRVAATIVLTPESDTFGMKTSTDRKPLYRKYAVASFELGGQPLELSIYQNIKYSQIEGHKNSLFLLFNDLTNGNETYGGGRYIDLEKSNTNTIIIDFNLSYNPYCHYNSKYSCPIPPSENNLPIPIEAGIKSYGKAKRH